MDFDRVWTIYALEAECTDFGMRRIADAHNSLRTEVERKDAYVAELVGACEVAFEVLEACVKPLGGCDDRAAISDAKDRLRTALDHTEAAAHTATEKNP